MEPGSRFWDVPAALVGLEHCVRATVTVPHGGDPRVVLGRDPSIVAVEARVERLRDLWGHPALRDLAPGMLVVRHAGGIGLRTATPELRALRARAALSPACTAEVAEVALSGVMVELRDLWAWTVLAPGQLADALDLYLTHPELEAPVEPFHSLARGMARREGIGLRAVTREVVRRDWRLTESGQVTVSERHEREGGFLGGLEEGERVWQSSALWRVAEARERTHFLERTRCSTCDHWLACGGYGARDGTEAAPAWCATWIPLFERLRSAFALVVQEASGGALEHYPG